MLQYFNDEPLVPNFISLTRPQLRYIGKILPEVSAFPRLLHVHEDCLEISILYSGESVYTIGNQTFPVRAGDVLIYNAGTPHDEHSGSDAKVGSYFLGIDQLSLPLLPENCLIPEDCSPVFHIDRDFQAVKDLCETLLHHTEHRTAWSGVFLHYEMQTLLEIILTVVTRSSSPRSSEADREAAAPILSYLDQHCLEPITMKEISSALHMSESYIAHTFKQATGYSPIQYLLRRKIGTAQTLLISSSASISEIAQMVGFDSQSHFNKRFKSYVKISPGQFRENYRNLSFSPTVL